MSVNNELCSFSEKYLSLVKHRYDTMTKGAFEEWMKETFEKVDTKMLAELEERLSFRGVSSSSETRDVKIPSMARTIISSAEAAPTIDSLFIGRSDLRLQMEQKFAEDIVALTVFNRFENNGKGSWVNFDSNGNFGLSVGNENIWKYKCELIDAMYNEMRNAGFVQEDPVYPHPEDSALEYDGKIQSALRTYRDFLSSHENAGDAYTEFAILQNFDKLLQSKTPFVTFNQKLNFDFADKYDYRGPNVEHYTGFTSSEFATIENQDSDLAKILLSVIPEVDANGKEIESSFVGLSGFNSAMTTLKRAILFSTDIFSDEAKQTYYDGLNIDLHTLIDEYINQLSNPTNKIPPDHRTFLLSKLRGIQKFIYSTDIEPVLKNMFTQMFFKTENVSYRAYTFDNDLQSFRGSNLRSNIVNTQRYQLEDAIRGAVYLLKTNIDRAFKLKEKYNIVVDDKGIHLSSIRDTMNISFINKNGKLQFSIDPRSNAFSQQFVENLISDILSIIIPDTYMRVGVQLSGNKFQLMDDFVTPLGLTLVAAFGPKNNTVIQYNKGNIINLRQYIDDLKDPAEKFSVIYGSETKNVVKSPSGNNLPTYQLTNMSYNAQSLLEDCRHFVKKNDWDQDPYESNVLVRVKNLLMAPQVRNEIRIGDKTKNPSQLTIKELLHVSVLYDFYEQLNSDDVIYLQNATFADKNTHFLVGYNLNAKIGNVTLRDLLVGTTTNKGILKGGSSKPILDLARASRQERLTRIVNNVLNDYKKVCLADINGHKILNPNKFRCSVDGFGFDTLEQLDIFLHYGQINVAKEWESEKWEQITVENMTSAFYDAGLIFDEEFDGYAPKNKSLGKLRVNETMMNFYNTYRSPAKFEARINKARRNFINNIKENKLEWNRYDSGTMSKIWADYQWLGKEWFDINSGNMKLFIGDTLHPILEAYFVADLFLSNEYNDLTIGEVFAHPNKNKRLSNIHNISAIDIYKNLGSKTQSPRVVITDWKNLKNFSSPFDNNGNIISTRLNGNPIESFGNTFTPDQRLMRPGMTKVNSTREAVEKYINAVITSNDPHYRWIREQCQSGNLKGKTIFYYSELNEPSHATALDYLINDFDWNSINSEFDPNKEEGSYEEFSEANRLIAQIKRSVAFGATYHPFAQNQLDGIASEIDIAIMNDMPGFVFTPNGEEGTVDSMDGSGISDALEARLESNSLIDARVGDNKKTIMMDVDRRLGKPILLKWAVYALTNRYRRNSSGSDYANGETLCRKMRSKYIKLINNIAEFYNQRSEKITYEDYNAGEYRRIDSVELAMEDIGMGQGVPFYIQHYTVIASNGEETSQTGTKRIEYNANTLYALDQLFGGAWTCKYENGEWHYTEDNTDTLLELISQKENQDLKDGFIAYAVNKSAIKVGAGNVNAKEAFYNNSPLMTIRMRTKYGGVQMDADQELDEEEVTEMTQMISSLIENSHYSDLVNEIYSDLGRVVAKHMSKFMEGVNLLDDKDVSANEKEAARAKLYTILGESLIKAFSTGSKDTLGLAQAFVQKASEALRNHEEFKLPFSAATINGAFISDVISSINRGGIRHKYEGLSGVLNPSYNMIQYYRVYNPRTGKFEVRMFEQLAELMRNEYNLHDMKFIQSDDASNPFIISQIQGEDGNLRDLTIEDIDFEDYIYIDDLTSNTTKTYYINTFEKYDDVKSMVRANPSNYKIRLHTAKAKNLRGADTRFIVDGTEYSYYDLDSVKASFYLNRAAKALSDGKNIDDVLKPNQKITLSNLGYNVDGATLPQLLTWLKDSQVKTQNTLRSIEFGRTFNFLGKDVIATSWRTRAPEIIMGRYQGDKFGFGRNDHIYQVQDENFFVNKLMDKYSAVSEDVLPENLYDIVLYEGDNKFYVKISNDNSIDSRFTQVGGLRDNSDFVINGNSIYYDNEEVMSTDGKRFKTFTNANGVQSNVIIVDNIDRYRELLNSGLFDRRIQTYNYTEENKEVLKQIQFGKNGDGNYWIWYKQDGERKRARITNPDIGLLQGDANSRKQIAIENKAKDMYDSFKQSLLYVGARIPTQAMQSFMPMEVVAFVDSDYNQVYVPAMQTYLEGSDYDIDKLYIMAFSVNNNGTIFTGSKLQDHFRLGIVSKVATPNGITYVEGNNGISINYHQLQSLLTAESGRFDDYNETEIINLLNSIYNSGSDEINFTAPGLTPEELENFEEDKKKFLEIINSHSESPRDVRGFALKNRIVSAIYNITTKPQNQLIAQVPINMDEQHVAADNSALGRAELHINSDDPSVKYMMQVQNMIGKQVIGISAVALKGFFAMTFVYSRYASEFEDSLEQNDSNDTLNKLRKLLLFNPITNEVTSIANLNLTSILEMLKGDVNKRILTVRTENIGNDIISQFIQQYAIGEMKINDVNLTQINLYGLLTELNKRVNRIDAALTLSGIISAATDNAKELILAKINATPELVDIYTYLTAIGTPFQTIANFMTSKEIQFVNSIGQSNIFESSTSAYNVKDAIKFVVGEGLLKGFPRNAVSTYLTLNGKIGNPYLKTEKLTALLEDSNLVEKTITKLNRDLTKWQRMTPQQIAQELARLDQYSDMEQGDDSFGRNIDLEPFTMHELRDAVKFLELVLERNKYLTNSNLKILADLLNPVKELSTFGRALGINQGQPTNLYRLKNMKESIRNWIDEGFGQVMDFNFDEFIKDSDYRQGWIDRYNDRKYTFNILEAMTYLPHFWEMFRTMYYSEQMIKTYSVKSKMVLQIAENIADNLDARNEAVRNGRKDPGRLRLSETDFKSIENYVNELMIARFLRESDFEVFISPEAMIKITLNDTPVHPYQTRRLKLNSIEGIENFKLWMDTYVFPRIIEKYKGNAFADSLRPLASIDERIDKKLTGWKLPLQMLDIDKAPNTIQIYGEILAGFNQIADQDAEEFGQTIGDLLYVYNMIVNKDSFGQNSFTRIFENLVMTSSGNMANLFNAYISRLDDSEMTLDELGALQQEAEYKINRDNPDSRVPFSEPAILQTQVTTAIDLPYFYKMPIKNVLTAEEIAKQKENLPKPAYAYDLDAVAITTELVKQLQKRTNADIHLITDEDLEQFKDSPQFSEICDSKGFIMNGEIYINLTKSGELSSDVLLHEFAHIVLAYLKFSDVPQNRNLYYTILSNVKNHPAFSEIAARYPNHIGSDLYEEVFANLLQDFLAGKEYLDDYGNSRKVSSGFMTNYKEDIIKSLNYLFDLQGRIVRAEDIVNKSMEDVLSAFGYNLLNSSVEISKAIIENAQIHNTIKQQLYNEQKITNSCDET